MTTEQTVVYVINTTGGTFDLYSNHSTNYIYIYDNIIIISGAYELPIYGGS